MSRKRKRDIASLGRYRPRVVTEVKYALRMEQESHQKEDDDSSRDVDKALESTFWWYLCSIFMFACSPKETF